MSAILAILCISFVTGLVLGLSTARIGHIGRRHHFRASYLPQEDEKREHPDNSFALEKDQEEHASDQYAR